MTLKDKLKEHIDKFLEEEISIDELIDKLIFIEKLEKRIFISEQGGTTMSEDLIKDEIEKWSK
jgi:hypothetical protein